MRGKCVVKKSIKNFLAGVIALLLVLVPVFTIFAESTAGTVIKDVEVRTPEEFIKAIASNTRVLIKTPTINLSDCKTEITNGNVSWSKSYNDFELKISNIKNLTIEGVGKRRAELIIESYTSEVLNFKNVENVSIKNINAWHKAQGPCSGSVLGFDTSKNITINNTELNGSGAWGLSLGNVSGLTCKNSTITHCTYGAISAYQCKNLSFYRTNIVKNNTTEEMLSLLKSSNIKFTECNVQGNFNITQGLYFALIWTQDSKNISFINSNISNNVSGWLMKDNKKQVVTFKGTKIINNTFTNSEVWIGNKLTTTVYNQAIISPPNNVVAKATDKTVTVSWNSVSGASEYEVRLGDKVAYLKGNSYTFIDLLPNSTYMYYVRAKKALATGAYSVPLLVHTAELQDAFYNAPLTPLKVVKVSAGSNHVLAIDKDGVLWAWGNNEHGQLGDGTTENKYHPAKVLTEVKDIATCKGVSRYGEEDEPYGHSVILKKDGTVWMCGINNNKDGTYQNIYAPTQLPELTDVKAICAGKDFSVALKENGTVWTWGKNGKGQLGNGGISDSSIPVQVSGLFDVIKISAGDKHCLALKEDKTVWAWGNNNFGQVGNGKNTNSNVPVKVIGLSEVTELAAGEHFSAVLKEGGTVSAWGTYSDFGIGTRPTPSQVNDITNVKEIAAGEWNCLAVKEDGTVWGWGMNMYEGSYKEASERFDGYMTSKDSPTRLTTIKGVERILAGNGYYIAIKEDGTVWSWGDNYSGQLGIGHSDGSNVPVKVEVSK